MFYLGNLRLELKRTTVIFEISILKLVKNEFLTHTVNFGKRSASSRGP